MARRKIVLIIFSITNLTAIVYGQSGDTKVDKTLVIVDRLASKVEFSLAWLDNRYPKSAFQFSLKSPTGKIITEDTPNPSVEVIDTALALAKGFRISGPEPGRWEVIVEHPWGVNCVTGAIVSSDLRMDFNFINQTPKINEPIIIQAKISEPEPIIGVDVLSKLKKYEKGSKDFTEFSIILEDDGIGNDKVAYDGVYTATFLDTSTEGSYCVDIVARGFSLKAGEFERKSARCTYVSDPLSKSTGTYRPD